MASLRKNIRAHRIFETWINRDGVTPGNNAVGALTEIDVNGNPFLGPATMKVYNVTPAVNGFLVRGEVDWHDDISIRVTVMFE